MENLNCSKCGNEILNNAAVCPDCGTPAPIEKQPETIITKSSNTIFKVLGGLALSLIGIVFIWGNISLHLIPKSLHDSPWFWVFDGAIMPILILFIVFNLMGFGKKKSQQTN